MLTVVLFVARDQTPKSVESNMSRSAVDSAKKFGDAELIGSANESGTVSSMVWDFLRRRKQDYMSSLVTFFDQSRISIAVRKPKVSPFEFVFLFEVYTDTSNP